MLGIVCFPFLSLSNTGKQTSALRQKTDEYVKIFTQNGLSGFFNRYEASGGLSEGQLGGVSSVRPDYETDLTVTFVPFAYETLYLKAFTGQEYNGTSWEKPSYNTQMLARELGANYEAYENYTAFLESRRLAHYTENNPGKSVSGKLRIQNIGANQNYLYLPYYASGEMTTSYRVSRGLASGVSMHDESYTVNYYPLMLNYWKINPQPDELLADLDPNSLQARYIAYYDMINSTSYIDMPMTTKVELDKIKEAIGTAANIDAQISAIRTYLHTNYKYSMTPGTTPRNADFAVHFLTKQNSGYCAHFATAATLLLRSYGIPARYVEGYAVSMQDVSEGEAIDEPYDEWFQGKNPLGETGVVRVNVTDANAHAWVEVYKIGIGWVPYEFTPPDTSDENSENIYSDFWGIFSGMFGQAPPPDAVNTTTEPSNTNSLFETLLGSSSFLARPLILFFGFLLLTVFLILLLRRLRTLRRMTKAYQRGDYAPLLSYRYRNLCTLLYKKGLSTKVHLLPANLPPLPDLFTPEECARQMELLEQCCYSQHPISSKEAASLLKFLKHYHNHLKRLKMN